MLPAGFVYLDEIDSSILFGIRYSTNLNFVGNILDGYNINRPIMTPTLAQALSQVQKQVIKDGFSLVIYDAYRPQKAVRHFARWVNSTEQKMKEKYYPYIDKSQSFELGYISKTSAHCRGSTVDLTIIDKFSKLNPVNEIIFEKRKLLDDREIIFIDNGTVDMGSSSDLFDEASWHQNECISKKYLNSRKYLREIMIAHGFDDYRKEWWHYRLLKEPYPDTDFDFDVL